MTTRLDDTICAIATPIGEGGIGIVRVSGPDALRFSSRVVSLRRGGALEDMRSHQLYLADVTIWEQDVENGKSSDSTPRMLDEVLAVSMRAPRSYTGEEVIEIHCHGGGLILATVCEALIRNGARMAEPGEFTRRAFLHGRLDLTQAEAVLDTIRATTTASLQVAQEQLKGSLSVKVEKMRKALIHVLAHLEAGLDFVEEDITFLEQEELRQVLQTLQRDLTVLIETAEAGRVIREGVVTAIIGKPNAGKSSLLNALVETDRAIVSAIPGTTRDVLEETVNLDGILLRLLDTAGIRQAGDELEKEGIRRTEEALEQAELVLLIIDASQDFSEDDTQMITSGHTKKRVIVLNKSDLPGKVYEGDIKKILARQSNECQQGDDTKVVSISAKSGDGLEQLRAAVRAVVLRDRMEGKDSVLVTRLRHKQALAMAQEAMMNALNAIAEDHSSDCVAVDLRVALDGLGEITGAVSTDDILDQVFSEFCIGK